MHKHHQTNAQGTTVMFAFCASKLQVQNQCAMCVHHVRCAKHKVLGVHFAIVVQASCKQCFAGTSVLCAQHQFSCTRKMQHVQCAKLEVLGMHCANVVQTFYMRCVSVPSLHCTQAVHYNQSVYNLRAACTVCNAKCARCALCKCCAIHCAQRVSVPRLPKLCAQAVHSTPSLCNVRAACKMCNAQCVRCALCKSCAYRCVQCVSGPRLPCAHAVYSAPSLCNVCVACKCAMLNVLGVLCANRARFAVCSVFLGPGYSVHMLCTIPHHCAMCMYLIRCAMLSVYLVRCDKSLPSANCCSAPMPEPTPLPLVCSACCA